MRHLYWFAFAGTMNFKKIQSFSRDHSFILPAGLASQVNSSSFGKWRSMMCCSSWSATKQEYPCLSVNFQSGNEISGHIHEDYLVFLVKLEIIWTCSVWLKTQVLLSHNNLEEDNVLWKPLALIRLWIKFQQHW